MRGRQSGLIQKVCQVNDLSDQEISETTVYFEIFGIISINGSQNVWAIFLRLN